MTPKLLNPEDVATRLARIRDYGACRGDGAPIEEAVADLRAHIAALEADNAAWKQAATDVLAFVRTVSPDMGGLNRCALTTGHAGPIARLRAMAEEPHPGAVLLSEHAKALVRARNEGLERAAVRAKEAAEHGCNPYTACTCDWESKLDGLEDDIRAMKETEG